jgi:hypothetical protein
MQPGLISTPDWTGKINKSLERKHCHRTYCFLYTSLQALPVDCGPWDLTFCIK